MDHAGLERMLSTTNWWMNLSLAVGAIGVFRFEPYRIHSAPYTAAWDEPGLTKKA